MDSGTNPKQELATLAGGCFWCLEAVYLDLQGVSQVESGYAGGWVPNPSYQAVCTGTTGHAEVVQLTYDPAMVSYRDLLNIFFTIHDPTTLNRQGNDIGPQYRSAIFTHSAEQEQIAREVVHQLEADKLWSNPIVTEIKPLDRFYPAEAYHQDYYNRNTSQLYCQVVIAPKVAKFRKKFTDRLKK
jgi:peptide-methionine (S)-S-oxide reductase